MCVLEILVASIFHAIEPESVGDDPRCVSSPYRVRISTCIMIIDFVNPFVHDIYNHSNSREDAPDAAPPAADDSNAGVTVTAKALRIDRVRNSPRLCTSHTLTKVWPGRLIPSRKTLSSY